MQIRAAPCNLVNTDFKSDASANSAIPARDRPCRGLSAVGTWVDLFSQILLFHSLRLTKQVQGYDNPRERFRIKFGGCSEAGERSGKNSVTNIRLFVRCMPPGALEGARRRALLPELPMCAPLWGYRRVLVRELAQRLDGEDVRLPFFYLSPEWRPGKESSSLRGPGIGEMPFL
jgi:hypothetical protein